MPSAATLTSAAALLLAAGCTTHAAQARQPAAGQSESSVAVSSATSTSARTAPSTSSFQTSPSSAISSAPPAPANPASPISPGQASSSAAVPRTRQVVLRPVTDTGRAAPGYTTEVSSADHRIDCGGSHSSYAYPSPVTVDAGPVTCGPSSEYALACWNGPTATTALCYRNPWLRQVVTIRTTGRLPALRPPAQPSPLGLVLSDGTRCSLRDGGAWAHLDGHPEMYGTYACAGSIAVWGGKGLDGVDRSRALWRVRLAPMTGHGQLHVLTVRTAYFVGTARS